MVSICRDIVDSWTDPNVAGDVLKLSMAQEYLGLVEQLETLREAGNDVLLAWEGGRRSMVEAMAHLSAVLRGSNPASERHS